MSGSRQLNPESHRSDSTLTEAAAALSIKTEASGSSDKAGRMNAKPVDHEHPASERVREPKRLTGFVELSVLASPWTAARSANLPADEA